MRWVTAGHKRRQRRVAQRDWHRWFAWRPVHIPSYTADSVEMPAMRIWWEYVERRGSLHDYINGEVYIRGSLFWQYRACRDKP